MTQPFRSSTRYTSAIWPAITVAYQEDYLLLHSPVPLTAVSSALWRGGIAQASHFINWKVPLTYRCEDPTIMMRDQLGAWGYPVDASIGLQTAAKITHASITEEAGDRYRILCCATAGTRNSARAGKARETFSAYQCGTINIFLLADAHLTPSAMINSVITATEAKSAALQDLGISDEDGETATGTTTDAVVFAATQDEAHGAPHQFAGAATTIGNAIGRLVYQAVYEAVATQGES
ncbi:adenosylcobinamide amidohydrolase [Aneurinibacillus sp. REN35]|uniref:adenosylcobinamide amidohydrolase n=1 Tax=Aneurinibacillus sp. REN35 TaxID=3237286 RepID=UPI003527C1FA